MGELSCALPVPWAVPWWNLFSAYFLDGISVCVSFPGEQGLALKKNCPPCLSLWTLVFLATPSACSYHIVLNPSCWQALGNWDLIDLSASSGRKTCGDHLESSWWLQRHISASSGCQQLCLPRSSFWHSWSTVTAHSSEPWVYWRKKTQTFTCDSVIMTAPIYLSFGKCVYLFFWEGRKGGLPWKKLICREILPV